MKNNGYIKASSSDVQKENSVRALKNLSTKSTNRLAMKKDTKVVNGLLYIASDKTVSLNLRNIAKDALRNLSPTGNDAWEKAEVRNTLLLVLSDEASTPKDKENSLRALGH